MRVFWSITLPQAGPTIAAALLLSFVSTFYETEGAWLIGAPQIRTMPVLMISFINNQPVIQYGAVLSVLLWMPSFVALMFARRVIGSGSFARGFGAEVSTSQSPALTWPSSTIRNVSKAFGAVRAVDTFDLTVADGELVCLLGPSGSGKSTLLRMIGGFETPTSGTITIDGEDVTRTPAREAPDRHGLPEPRALDPHERLPEPRLRPQAPPPAPRRDRPQGRRRPRPGRPRPATASG